LPGSPERSNREVDEVIGADFSGLIRVDVVAGSRRKEEGMKAMKFGFGWLNQPYMLMIAALVALGFAIAGAKSDDPDSPNPTDRYVIHANQPDPLTDFLISRGWEDPPAPGDLTPTCGQGAQGLPTAPDAPTH
jgi:hypothetical protein